MLTCNGRTAGGLGGCCCGAVRRLRLLDLDGPLGMALAEEKREAAFVRVVVRSNSEPKWCKEVIEGDNSHSLKCI